MHSAAKVLACPVAGGHPGATDLEMLVNGQPVGIELYTPPPLPEEAPVWFVGRQGDAPWLSDMQVYLARFACAGPCNVRLTAPGREVPPLVRPKSRGVPAEAEGDRAELSLPGPGKYYVDFSSGPPLLVIADPLDAPWYNPPEAQSRYFGPGVHEPGLMTLEDGETVHIDAGALVYGGFRGSPIGARVIGAGVLDGSKVDRGMVRLQDAEDFEVRGVVMRGGNGWQNTLSGCRSVAYRGVSVLSSVPSGDGVNPVGCRDVVIEDCFFRCSDDCMAVKARHAGAAVGDISVRRCVMVGYALSDGFTVGFEMVADTVSRIRVQDCDVLYSNGTNAVGYHSAFSIICDGPATVSDVLFEDIRVEENVERLFEINVTDGQKYVHEPAGRVRGVTVRNVSWEVEKPIILHGHDADHMVRDVLFDGCNVAGRSLAEVKDRVVQQNEFVTGLRYS